MGGVSSKAAASIFVPSTAVPSRLPRSFWISHIYRPSVSLSSPHLAYDEAHALHHGYACSENTSASLRPQFPIPLPSSILPQLLPNFHWDRGGMPQYFDYDMGAFAFEGARHSELPTTSFVPFQVARQASLVENALTTFSQTYDILRQQGIKREKSNLKKEKDAAYLFPLYLIRHKWLRTTTVTLGNKPITNLCILRRFDELDLSVYFCA